ncbi:hypothetical protein J7413_10120 [Shimia sp. R10_1]|uniref:PaaX family transcriptional regulator C-terminal domain-containing protein n=1 Tax=Shimia sp. R10_1 TaxID=2821095 RepID=UPI001ADA0A8D|nr:PaaX family transcriptional regulator C-terminal domain-containing protein [Shimia sp. R10_1]MBO9473891.1 hypothetical protein [Shimia sp. R10_1]
MQQIDLPDDIKTVRDCGPIKVWSVVVTILGDLLQDEDAWMSGPVLDALVGCLGINNQALRVALHRLRRDGWIVTQKRGRMSVHRLSPTGWAATERARPQVYGMSEQSKTRVDLLIGSPALSIADFETRLPEGSILLSTRSALVSDVDACPDGCVLSPFNPTELPNWVVEIIAPNVMRAEYDELASAVETALHRPTPDDCITRTALRLVVLHHWRRLCLRHGVVPNHLLGQDWEGAQARLVVMRALNQWTRPTIDVLEQRLTRR